LSKVYGDEIAIAEAEKLKLENNPFYFSLLAELSRQIEPQKSKQHLEKAIALTKSKSQKELLQKKLTDLNL
jgi:RNA polymerase sigma-70 factor (ECF subfamily)